MSANVMNDDLRSRKTEKALYTAMFSLLRKQSFRKITIKGICEEALVSRAAFYTHFIDKYDLLGSWISELWPTIVAGCNTYDQLEKKLNDYVRENAPVFKNLVYDADDETFRILFNFITSTINLAVDKSNVGDKSPKDVVLANFYAGGIIAYYLWLIKNKFPADVPPVNKYFYEMIRNLQGWMQ